MKTDSFFKFTLLAMILCLGALGVCPAETIHVDQSAEGTGDGATWQNAYTSLQDALAAAKSGDHILVAEGVYTPDSGKKYKRGNQHAHFALKNGVVCSGGFAAGGGEEADRKPSEYQTVLSGDLAGDDDDVITGFELSSDTTRTDNAFHVLWAKDLDSTTILDGFVVAGGNASKDFGAGIRLIQSSPVIRNCAFTENYGSCAPAMFMEKDSHPDIDNCVFTLNTTSGCCGAVEMRSSTPVFSNCIFSFNNGEQGGAVRCVYSKPVFTDCNFVGNRAKIAGGAVQCYGADAVFHRCRFLGNFSEGFGGACHLHASDPTWTNCIFVGNACGKEGGTIHGCKHTCNPELINCTLAANNAKYVAGGILIGEEGKTTLTNCIVWGNTDRQGAGEKSQLKFKYLIASNTCIQGLTEASRGLEIFGDDPLFVQPPDDGGDGWGDKPETCDVDEGENDNYGDLRLSELSPCINAGTVEPPLLAGHLDMEGNSRITGDRIDIGAMEFQTN